jgi:alpha-ketoglutarate-dependent taurine dioxygenase
MEYIGGAAVRTQLTDRVFTANESPPSEKIPFHHEMSQVPHPPTHLFFYCEQAPEVGGETPLLVSHHIYARVKVAHPDFMDKLERLGVRYVRVLPEYDDPTSAVIALVAMNSPCLNTLP